MAKSSTSYACQSCGTTSPKWSGKCEACGGWNTITEEGIVPPLGSGATRRAKGRRITLEGHADLIHSVVFSPDGAFAVSGSDDCKVHLWDLNSGVEVRRFTGHTDSVTCVAISPNGRWMVFSSKSRGPYTRMFLTHLDENGQDSPAILIDNPTAANVADSDTAPGLFTQLPAEVRYVLGDQHYNTPELRAECAQ